MSQYNSISAVRLARWFMALAMAGVCLSWGCRQQVKPEAILAGYQPQKEYPALVIEYPLNQAVFPPEMPPPTFRWQDSAAGADAWVISLRFADGSNPDGLNFLAHQRYWQPGRNEWETIKKRCNGKSATVEILGFRAPDGPAILSRGRVAFAVATDVVGSSIFYREVNLPFLEAVKDPTRIRWRYGEVGSPQPPRVVLENLPVCGNCHSFSKDGAWLAMDVDYANNKGSYVITRTAKQMSLATSDIITWDDFRREDKQLTYGFLSQISPDGRYVISTVKDKSVFVGKPDLAFSQLFFPIKGILAVYNRDTREFAALPGANDPEYVQSNPVWSPDGKFILFARAKAYDLRKNTAADKLLLSPDECDEFLKEGKPFQFDLYRIAFNNGQGGKPEPVLGASHNGKSNYFPKFSPDGQWIVFCQAKSYMLLQPDSELYLIPAAGGEARRLHCNTSRMNSWHSWSPNGKWMVFSSKANSPYTQLWLAHFDGQGNFSPPVVLDHFTDKDRAANIPEFVSLPGNAIERIQQNFLNDMSHARAAYAFERAGEIDNAIRDYRKALAINPNNDIVHQRLGYLLYHVKRQFKEGQEHSLEAVRLDPQNPGSQYNLGMTCFHQGNLDAAIQHLEMARQLKPEGVANQYGPADVNYHLAGAYFLKADFENAAARLTQAIQYAPNNAEMHYRLAMAQAHCGKVAESLTAYQKAMALQPGIDTAPELHAQLAVAYAKAGQWPEAATAAERALTVARAQKEDEAITEIEKLLAAIRAHRLPQE